MFIAVAPSLGVATLPELIALAKQRPGELSYAATGVGRLTHLTGELLQSRAGIKLLLVPYSGGPTHALNDVLGGRIPVIIEAYAGLAGAVQAGKIKPIAIGRPSACRTSPTFRQWRRRCPASRRGLAGPVAPNGTPEPILGKVAGDLRRVLAQPEVAKQLATPRRLSQPDVAGRGHRLRAGPTANVESAAAAVRRAIEMRSPPRA